MPNWLEFKWVFSPVNKIKREKGEWKETRTKNESNEFLKKVFQNRGSVV